MRYICISLWVLFLLTPFAAAESKYSQDVARRQVWAQELGRWSRYCLRRTDQHSQPFKGCIQRVNGIRANQALFRLIRLDGFIQPHQEVIQASTVQQWLNKIELSVEERIAMIELAYEGLVTSGDLTWYSILLDQIKKSAWFGAVQCPLEGQCATELLTVLKIGKRLEQSLKYSQHSVVEQYILNRLPALMKVAQYLSQPHPLGTAQSDHTHLTSRSLWGLRAELAVISLNDQELAAWWKTESKAMADLRPVNVSRKEQFGINFSRMRGLGRIIARSSRQKSQSLDLLTQYQKHAQTAMETYMKNRRNIEYTHYINPLGVMALNAEINDDEYPWGIPARRWLKPEQRLFPSSLPSEVIRASGMFSEIEIRDDQNRRGLYFIRPNGQQLLETEINLSRPDLLQVRYTQDMLGVYPFFKTKPQRALLIGLGGGAMVHALRGYDPGLNLDVVEIDPVVVRFAREFFGIKSLEQTHTAPQGQLRIITEDGFTFLAPTPKGKSYPEM